MFSLIAVAGKIGFFLTLYGLVFAKLVRKPEAQWVKQRLLPITVGLFVGGMLLPSIWLYWLLIATLIPVLSRSTAEAACLYVLIMIVSPTVAREIGIGGIYLLPFDKWLFGGLGLAIAALIHRSRKPLNTGWFDLPFLLVVSLELVLARGLNVTSVLRTFTGVSVSLIFPYFMVSRALRTPEDIRKMIFAITFAAFVLSCEAMYEFKFGFLPYEAISQHLGVNLSISTYSKQRSGGLRAATSFPESTTFGLFIALAFLAALASRPSFKNRRSQILALIAILGGLYASNARSPIIALTLGILAYDFYRKRYGAMTTKIIGLAGLAAIAFSAAQFSPKIADRLGVSGGSVDTTNYRQLLYKRGKEEIAKHPYSGVSVSQAYTDMADLKQGEGIIDFVNGYVFYGLVAGVGGILVLLFCFFGTAARMLMVRARLRKDAALTSIGGLVFSAALCTSVTAFTSGFGGKTSVLFYVLLAVGAALGSRPARTRLSRRAIDPDPIEPERELPIQARHT